MTLERVAGITLQLLGGLLLVRAVLGFLTMRRRARRQMKGWQSKERTQMLIKDGDL